MAKDRNGADIKVGDRVRCVKGAGASLIEGREYVVTKDDGCFLDLEGEAHGWLDSRFELVKPPLKAGDKVRFIRDNGNPKWGAEGDEGTIACVHHASNVSVNVDGGGTWFAHPDVLEVLPAALYRPGDNVRIKATGEVDTVVNGVPDLDGDIETEQTFYTPDEIELFVSPFKIGDKVRVIKDGDGPNGSCHGNEVGAITTLTEVGTDDYFYDGRWYYKGDEIELVTTPPFGVGDFVRMDHWAQGLFYEVLSISNDNIVKIDALDGNVFTYGWNPTEPAWEVQPASARNPAAIVALIEGGQPKPSLAPHVHPDVKAAIEEADRLSRKHLGKRFGVYQLVDIKAVAKPTKPTNTYKWTWQQLAMRGRKIDAIKELQRVSGLYLRGAKDAVEVFIAVEAA